MVREVGHSTNGRPPAQSIWAVGILAIPLHDDRELTAFGASLWGEISIAGAVHDSIYYAPAEGLVCPIGNTMPIVKVAGNFPATFTLNVLPITLPHHGIAYVHYSPIYRYRKVAI